MLECSFGKLTAAILVHGWPRESEESPSDLGGISYQFERHCRKPATGEKAEARNVSPLPLPTIYSAEEYAAFLASRDIRQRQHARWSGIEQKHVEEARLFFERLRHEYTFLGNAVKDSWP